MTHAEAKLQGFYKICVTGNFGVGKSSLILRYVDSEFSASQRVTLGVDAKYKTLEIDGDAVKIKLCDTAGQERFKTITSPYYRGSHGVIFVYDVTDEESFQNLLHWMDEIERYAHEAVKMIVGNKIDLAEQRVVLSEKAKEFAEKEGVPYYETSAKSPENVDKMFEEMTRFIHYNLNGHPAASLRRIKLKEESFDEMKKRESKKCCA